jgi:glycosyltransferase involved in cell wall biosynthesis
LTRILLLSPYEPPSDGIARHSAHLVEAWDAAGHTVLVIAPGTQRGLGGATVIGSRSMVARNMRKIPRRNILLDAIAFEPDIVFVQFSIATFNVDLWSVQYLSKRFRAARIPVVVAFHEAAREFDLIGPVSHLIYRSMARVTDVPIAFSSAGRQSLLDRDLFGDVVEVPHGTKGVTHITESECSRVKDLYHVKKPLVLSLGYTDSDKGTDVLLAAADAIANGVGHNVQFLIAGSPRRRRGVFRIMELRDIRFRRRLRRQAAKLTNVEIDFSNYVADNDVAALLRVAEVVVLPYRRSTQSGVGNLALSSRSVLVSSNLPGLKSNLGTAALYVEVGDSRAMAEQIIGLLGDDHESIREQLRERSGERADSNTFEKTAEMILSVGLAHRDPRAPE